MCDVLDDVGEQGFEPVEKGFAAGVSYAEPDDDRSGFALAQPMGKVFILGDDDGVVLEGIVPDGGVVGVV